MGEVAHTVQTRFAPGKSGNPGGKVKGTVNKKDRVADYCSSERCANRLALRIREFWFLRRVMVKVWVVPIYGHLPDGAKAVLCYAVRSNLGALMEKKE